MCGKAFVSPNPRYVRICPKCKRATNWERDFEGGEVVGSVNIYRISQTF